MNGVSIPDSGVQSADPGEPRDSGFSLSRTFEIIRAAKAAFEARGEWRLAREIEDALARWDSEQSQIPLFVPTGTPGEGERSSKGVHGEDPPEAEVRTSLTERLGFGRLE
jgi:hypothetical protein